MVRLIVPITAIAHQSWPGNVRELQNFIERSVSLSKGPVLNGSLSALRYTQKASASVTLEEAESSHIMQTLRETGGGWWSEWRRCSPGRAPRDVDLQDAATDP